MTGESEGRSEKFKYQEMSGPSHPVTCFMCARRLHVLLPVTF